MNKIEVTVMEDPSMEDSSQQPEKKKSDRVYKFAAVGVVVLGVIITLALIFPNN